MFSRVLVPLDDSLSASGALAFALEVGRRFGSELVLCNSVDRAAATAAAVTPDGALGDIQTILDECESASRRLLLEAAAGATATGIRVTTLVLDGRPAPAIVDCAKNEHVDAIVMGTHGKNGLERLLLGSTAEGVLRMTTVPVIVVREPRGTPGHPPAAPPVEYFERILVAIDDSEPSDAAMAFALDLAEAKHSRLLCCTVIETGDVLDKASFYGYDPMPLLANLRQHAADLIALRSHGASERGITVESVIVEENAPIGILEAVKEHAADLVVIGTHGRRGLRRFFIGSVAENVVRHSDVPVAVVRGRPAAVSAAAHGGAAEHHP